MVKAVRKLAKEADEVVIATDFDREGELIGHEALQQALEANPAIANGDKGDPAEILASRPPIKRCPLLGPHQGRDRARVLEPRRASPTTSPTPAPPGRTST